MGFKHSIERIGAPTASGLVPRRNVGDVTRQGVELDVRWRASSRVDLGANLWASHNRIAEFVDSTVSPVVVRHDVPPLLTPGLVTAQRAEFRATSQLTIGIEGHYQGRAYLDNTKDVARTLPASYVVDASARLTRNRYALVVRGANLGNSQRYGSGSVSTDGEVRYFVLASRSVFTTFELSW
ncbi:MAG: hypothetical protein U0163_14515 [Gemmatimonadaceae bacterium]